MQIYLFIISPAKCSPGHVHLNGKHFHFGSSTSMDYHRWISIHFTLNGEKKETPAPGGMDGLIRILFLNAGRIF